MGNVFTVKDFMTISPHCIDPQEQISTGLHRMREHHVRHLPVRSGGHIVGVISSNDINFALRYLQEDARVADVMIPDPFCASEEESLGHIATRMIEDRISSAIIVDGNHNVKGIFTYVDALKALLKLIH